MSTGTILISMVIATVLTLFVIFTGVFRRLLTYALDIIWTFVVMVLFVLGVLQFLSLLP